MGCEGLESKAIGMPSQVFLSVTPEMRSFLSTSNAKGVEDWANEDAIDMDELYKLVEEHNQGGGDIVKIHELMENTEVVERRHVQSAQLTELESLRLRSQERAYQNSVKGLTPVRSNGTTQTGIDVKGMKFATNFGMQVIVAFIGAFLLGWYFVETFVAPDNMVAKALAGAGCSFCTLLLESALFVVHEQKQEMLAKKRAEQRVREEHRGSNLKQPTGKATAAGTAASAGTTEKPAEGNPETSDEFKAEEKSKLEKKED